MKSTTSLNPWLAGVEALEEKLEAVKLSSWGSFRVPHPAAGSIVRSTAGLLGKRIPSGSVYERHLRREWEQASHRRAS